MDKKKRNSIWGEKGKGDEKEGGGILRGQKETKIRRKQTDSETVGLSHFSMQKLQSVEVTLEERTGGEERTTVRG